MSFELPAVGPLELIEHGVDLAFEFDLALELSAHDGLDLLEDHLLVDLEVREIRFFPLGQNFLSESLNLRGRQFHRRSNPMLISSAPRDIFES